MLVLSFHFRHQQIMNAFRDVNQNINYLGNQLRAHTRNLVYIIERTEIRFYMASIHNAVDYYDNYVRFKGHAGYGRHLASALTNVESSIFGLKNAIGNYFDSYNQQYADFDMLFDVMTYITAILTKTKCAISIGCIEACYTYMCKYQCYSRPR